MLKIESNKLVGNLIGMTLLAISCFFLISGEAPGMRAPGRQAARKIIDHSSWPNQPLVFMIATIGKRDHKFKEEFDGDENWMKGLSIKLQSVSKKNIIYASVLLQFPETKATGRLVTLRVSSGRNPADPPGSAEERIIRPGDVVDIPLSDDKHGVIKSFLKSKGFENVSKLELQLDTVDFDDGVKWFGGYFSKVDPDDPTKRIFVDR